MPSCRDLARRDVATAFFVLGFDCVVATPEIDQKKLSDAASEILQKNAWCRVQTYGEQCGRIHIEPDLSGHRVLHTTTRDHFMIDIQQPLGDSSCEQDKIIKALSAAAQISGTNWAFQPIRFSSPAVTFGKQQGFREDPESRGRR